MAECEVIYLNGGPRNNEEIPTLRQLPEVYKADGQILMVDGKPVMTKLVYRKTSMVSNGSRVVYHFQHEEIPQS